jgi:hypothetical protein
MNADQHKRYFEYQNWFYIFGESPFKEIEKAQEVHYLTL